MKPSHDAPTLHRARCSYRKVKMITVTRIRQLALILTAALAAGSSACAAPPDHGAVAKKDDSIKGPSCQDPVTWLGQSFALTGPRTPETRRFKMETKVVYIEADGTRGTPVVLRLELEASPVGESEEQGHRYQCLGTTYQRGEEPEVGIPSLKGYAYVLRRNEDGSFHQDGKIFGLDHGRFQSLVDDHGNPMPPEMCFSLHNMFVDFHAFCDQFARSTASGKGGMQDLRRVGDRIVHEAAFSNPTEQLTGSTGQGSEFRNGEVTLRFVGLSLVDERPCAVVHFDSGDSSFNIAVNHSPELQLNSVGAAHYWGDLFLELESKWVRQCVMGEFTVSQTSLGADQVINAVMERTTTIRSQ